MKNFECEKIRTDGFGRKFTFIKDSDGQLIELIKRKLDIRPFSYKTEDKWVEKSIEQFGTESSFV